MKKTHALIIGLTIVIVQSAVAFAADTPPAIQFDFGNDAPPTLGGTTSNDNDAPPSLGGTTTDNDSPPSLGGVDTSEPNTGATNTGTPSGSTNNSTFTGDNGSSGGSSGGSGGAGQPGKKKKKAGDTKIDGKTDVKKDNTKDGQEDSEDDYEYVYEYEEDVPTVVAQNPNKQKISKTGNDAWYLVLLSLVGGYLYTRNSKLQKQERQ